MIHCIGCSWTENWPRYLNGATWEYRDGCGLWAFEEPLRKCKADHVVVQLPTPIRSFRRGSTWAGRTRELFLGFWHSTLPNREGRLLNRYRDELLRLNAIREGITFFEFNTAGYPFRHPFDFGELASDVLESWAALEGLNWLRLDLSGLPGMCKIERVDGKRNDDEPSGWSVINPPGLVVVDGHPSEQACRIAAERVEKWSGSGCSP